MIVWLVLPITMVFNTRTALSPISLEAAPARGEESRASRNRSWARSGHWHRVLYLEVNGKWPQKMEEKKNTL